MKLKKPRLPQGDDGHVVANMNVEGMPWYRPQQGNPDGGAKLSRRETWLAMRGALGAALTVVGVLSAGMVLFVLFCVYVWFK